MGNYQKQKFVIEDSDFIVIPITVTGDEQQAI